MSRGLGAFAQGLGSGLQAGQDRQERRALIDALANAGTVQPGMGSAPAAAPPPVPGSSRLGGAGTVAAPAAAVSGARGNPFDNLVMQTESGGGFDTLFGHSQREGGQFAGVDVSRMTIGEAIEFSNPRGPYAQWVRGQVGRVATPMGYYQIVGTTLRNTAREMGLSMDTPFNSDTQRAMGEYLGRQRVAAATTDEGRRAALRAEWEGFRHASDAQVDAAVAYLMQ